MKKALLFTGLLAVAAFFSCKKEDNKQAEADRALIVADLAARGLTATEDPSGIFYIIDSLGDGTHPKANSRVKVTYVGRLLDGTEFDRNEGSFAIFELDGLIKGWKIGIPKLERGGGGRFWIPSGLGYGKSGSGSIPGNSVLFFEIGLIDFQ